MGFYRNADARCLVSTQSVTSDFVPLQRRVESVVQIAMAIVTPLSALAPGHNTAKSLSLVDDIPAAKKRAPNGAGDGDDALQPIAEDEPAAAAASTVEPTA